MVKHCRVDKPSSQRRELPSLRWVVGQSLAVLQGKRKHGQRPRTALSRELQDLLGHEVKGATSARVIVLETSKFPAEKGADPRSERWQGKRFRSMLVCGTLRGGVLRTTLHEPTERSKAGQRGAQLVEQTRRMRVLPSLWCGEGGGSDDTLV